MLDENISKLEEQLNSVKGSDCEVWARVVGFYRPLKNWNAGKREEYRQRATYNVPQLPESVGDSITRDTNQQKRTTFRPDQKGALPIIADFEPLQLGKASDDWELGNREEGANEYQVCDSCQ